MSKKPEMMAASMQKTIPRQTQVTPQHRSMTPKKKRV